MNCENKLFDFSDINICFKDIELKLQEKAKKLMISTLKDHALDFIQTEAYRSLLSTF